MRRFKFSLESVLTVRKKALEDERITLASIINIFNKQKDVLDEMTDVLNSLNYESENYIQNESFNPTIAYNYKTYSIKLTQDIKTQQAIIQKTQQDLNRQQQIVQKAYIEVKSLEKLKEKQKQNYDKEAQLEEFKQIDDIVNSRRISA